MSATFKRLDDFHTMRIEGDTVQCYCYECDYREMIPRGTVKAGQPSGTTCQKCGADDWVIEQFDDDED